MQDKVSEVLEVIRRQESGRVPAENGPQLDLISLRRCADLDAQAIRDFLAAVRSDFGVDLVLLGGGYGCCKFYFEIQEASILLSQSIAVRLLEDAEFRRAARKAGFSVAILRDPYMRADLRTDTVDIFNPRLRAFCSYAHEDDALRRQLVRHLSTLTRSNKIDVWNDRNINAGEDWKKQIDANLNRADIVLFLLSADFFASDYIDSVEIQTALERQRRDACRIVPILIRPTAWEHSRLSDFQIIPRAQRKVLAVTSWPNRDEAWVEVVRKISGVIEELHQKRMELKRMLDSVPNVAEVLGKRSFDAGSTREQLKVAGTTSHEDPHAS